MDRKTETVLAVAVGIVTSLSVNFGVDAYTSWVRGIENTANENNRSNLTFNPDNPIIKASRAEKNGLPFPQLSEEDLRIAVIWEFRNTK